MQVHMPFVMDIIYKNTHKIAKLTSFEYGKSVYAGQFINRLNYEYGKPIGFKLIKLNVPITTPKLINWLQTDFKDMFEYDPLIWLASVGTMPIELHQYLIPFHKDTHDTTIS